MKTAILLLVVLNIATLNAIRFEMSRQAISDYLKRDEKGL
jgi:hypothetical protein